MYPKCTQDIHIPSIGLHIYYPLKQPLKLVHVKVLQVGCLWFFVIAFMFFAQHHVCDAYFVPAINVFVGKMKTFGHCLSFLLSSADFLLLLAVLKG